jgi:hypothetical protein
MAMILNVRQMSTGPSSDLWEAFIGRSLPRQWLRDDLDPIDRRFGEEFVTAVQSGASPEEYFLSAVPFLTFLTPEVAAYFLPAFFRSALQASIQLCDLDRYFYTATGQRTLALLRRDEREAIERFLLDFPHKADASGIVERLRSESSSQKNA